MQILGILAFVVALLLSVMIHEFGHFLTAKHYGMKVSEFFLGFGARIWSTKRGETEFGIKAIPAGGYCRIEGMVPTDVMEAGEEDRAFYRASSGRKLIVLGAGSFLHFVLGYILIFILFAGVGVNQLLPTISQIWRSGSRFTSRRYRSCYQWRQGEGLDQRCKGYSKFRRQVSFIRNIARYSNADNYRDTYSRNY